RAAGKGLVGEIQALPAVYGAAGLALLPAGLDLVDGDPESLPDHAGELRVSRPRNAMQEDVDPASPACDGLAEVGAQEIERFPEMGVSRQIQMRRGRRLDAKGLEHRL